MFGEVFDTTKPYTSHFTTTDRVQAVIDFPFQAAAQGFAAEARQPTDRLRDFFVGDDWYTDADSNAYQLPTFLGNHDMGRIGRFIRDANRGAADAEVLARDKLAHELMYLSRGNPVIYYGDEQGFVGDGGDQDARQDMFPSQVAHLQRRRPDRHRRDDRAGELRRGAPALSRASPRSPSSPRTARCATAPSSTGRRPRAPASTRSRAWTAPSSASTWSRSTTPRPRRPRRPDLQRAGCASRACTAPAPRRARPTAPKKLDVTVPALSAVVYRAERGSRSPRPRPRSRCRPPTPAADRARGRRRRRRRRLQRGHVPAPAQERRLEAGSAPTTTGPTACSTTSSGLDAGHEAPYSAVVLDNAGTRAERRARPARRGAGDHARGPGRGRQAARRAPRCARSPRPTTPVHGDAPAPRRDRRLDDDRARRLVARLHGVRRPRRARAGHRRVLPGHPRPRRRDGDERGPHRQVAPAPSTRRSSTTAARTGTTTTGACTCSATRSPTAAATAWDAPRMPTRFDGYGAVFEIPLEGRHEAGELHRPQAERRQRADDAGAGRRPVVRPGRPPGDLARGGDAGRVLRGAVVCGRWRPPESSSSPR